MERTNDVDVQAAEAWVVSSAAIVGHLELVQIEPWASVFRAPLPDGETVWFKACAPHSGFEVPLTASLFARWPATVAEVLAHDLERRWLLMADAGDRIAELGNPPERWLDLLPDCARLQIGEVDHTEDHLDVGVPDMRLARLPERYEELAAAELPLPPNKIVAIRAFAQSFAGLCADLEGDGIEATVQHDDLHMNNVYVRDGTLRVLDWGDASISHPFFSLFETFRFLTERNRLSSHDPWFERLRDAYLEPWGPGHRATFDLALRVAGFARAIAWLDQRSALPVQDRAEFDTGFGMILRLALQTASD